ncbi:hypothetical protein GCM10010305_61680 [Streptomyces termitum]|uniref:Uncharacterized protein n=1 Tax=Streptomyces termitum TaxID=67368 RepID=A0A918TAZ8_9ACTN|nr:hypothetical protein GCM10010305_61680 [Streptomyces termitum]
MLAQRTGRQRRQLLIGPYCTKPPRESVAERGESVQQPSCHARKDILMLVDEGDMRQRDRQRTPHASRWRAESAVLKVRQGRRDIVRAVGHTPLKHTERRSG